MIKILNFKNFINFRLSNLFLLTFEPKFTRIQTYFLTELSRSMSRDVWKNISKGKTRSKFTIRINLTEMAEEMDQEFLDFIVKSIVDSPDEVKVERTIDERGVLLTLTVSPQDMGMIIGRQGSTAKAIRTLLRVVGAKNDARINLKINEPEGSERRFEKKEEDAPEAKSEESEKSIDDIVNDIK